MTRISEMTPLTSLPASGAYVPVEKTGSTANYRFDLSSLANLNGLLANAATMTIPAGTDIIQTSGYSTLDVGSAVYVYDAAVDAAYLAANPRTSFISANGRGFRLSAEQDFVPQMFGAVGDGTTDDGPAFTAAIAFLKSIASNDQTIYKGSSRLRCAAAHYFLNTTTLEITHTLIIEGEGNGQAGGVATKLRWAANTTGIRVQRYNTSGASTVDGVTHYAGDATIIQNLYLMGAFTTLASEGAYHGIHAKARVLIRDCVIDHFQGDGIRIESTTGGNANCFAIERCYCLYNQNGIYLDGADANAGYTLGCDLSYNRQWGLWDSSFLGNRHSWHHTTNNGFADNGLSGAPYAPPTVVSRGGRRSFVIAGQEVGASTNPPKSATATITIASPGVVTWNAHGLVDGTQVAFSTTGALPTGLTVNTTYYVINSAANTFQLSLTLGGSAINTSGSQSGVHTAGGGVDNTWWRDMGAGGVLGASIPAWNSGDTYRSGGSYRCDDSNQSITFLDCYAEGGQGLPQSMGSYMFIGGTFGGGLGNAPNNGSYLYGANQGIGIRGDAVVGRNLLVSGSANGLGSASGTAADSTTLLRNTSTYSNLNFQTYDAAGNLLSDDGQIFGENGVGLVLNGKTNGSAIRFRANGAAIGTIKSTGFDLASGKVLLVNGTQVVGAQQGAPPADATDLATAIALVNSLKAIIRTHGLAA